GDAMKRVFLADRPFDPVKQKEMIILDATTRELADRELNKETVFMNRQNTRIWYSRRRSPAAKLFPA
ncbi:MAG: hypothetical protein FWG22_04670, partial [Prolixibacteraceae bacterium]|nr:hypothetical protein [Prolixibacteraceae bacterium]